MRSCALLIAGPTASGKSALALRLAEALAPFGGAAIINADSMQVYRDLRILTARPTDADLARAPHYLYGFRGAAEPCSAGVWAELAAQTAAQICAKGRLPILVGGTGLYLRAFSDGMARVPEVPPQIRAQARRLMAELGPASFHEKLAQADPQTAALLRPTDPQRLLRAWEVWQATGVPLAEWQSRPSPPLFDGELLRIALTPPRDWVYANCDARFEAMLAQGVLDEVAALDALVHAQNLAGDLPILRAAGLPQLQAHLRGENSQLQAILQAKTATKQYAKRQMTWIRNQMIAWNKVDAQDSERLFQEIFALIIKSGLTD